MQEELKKLYDGKKINEVISTADQFCAASKESRIEFIKTLYYLKFTQRFRELPLYKKSTFDQFLMDRFNTRITTFEKEVRAFARFPEETKDLGAGLIDKIDRKCGSDKTGKVIGEIKKAREKKKNKLSRGDVEKIIQQHALPQKPKPTVVPISEIERQLEAARKENAELNKALAERNEQINRMKKTIELKDIEIQRLQNEVNIYRKPMMDIFNSVKGMPGMEARA